MTMIMTHPEQEIPDVIFNRDLFTNVYWRLREAKNRFVMNYGSASSSKSFSQMQLSIQKTMEEEYDGLVIRKFASDIENSVYDGIRSIIDAWGMTNMFSFTYSNQKRQITNLETGRRILFKGLDDPEKIKSIFGIKWIYVEEANQLEEDDFRELNRRIRGIPNVQIYFVFNPIIENHWIKKWFFDMDVYSGRIDVIHSTYKDNPFNTQEDIDELEALRFINENEYNIYALGRWGKVRTGQEFYSAFQYSKHVQRRIYIPDIPIHISFDQNVIPYITMTIYQIHRINGKYKINALDELCLSNPKNTTEALCEEFLLLHEKKLKGGLYFYGDATGRNRDTRGRENDYDIVERILWKHLSSSSNRVPKSNPPVIKRREWLNRVLAGRFPIEILIDPKCKKLIADFEMVQEGVDGKKFKRKKKDKNSGISFEEYGHTSDTFDYFMTSAFESLIDF